MGTPCLTEERGFPAEVGPRDGEGHAGDPGLAAEGAGAAQVAAGGHHGTALIGQTDSAGLQGKRPVVGYASSVQATKSSWRTVFVKVSERYVTAALLPGKAYGALNRVMKYISNQKCHNVQTRFMISLTHFKGLNINTMSSRRRRRRRKRQVLLPTAPILQPAQQTNNNNLMASQPLVNADAVVMAAGGEDIKVPKTTEDKTEADTGNSNNSTNSNNNVLNLLGLQQPNNSTENGTSNSSESSTTVSTLMVRSTSLMPTKSTPSIHLLVVDVTCVLFCTQPVCMLLKQYTRNIYHKQMNKIRSGSNASTDATTSEFTIAGIGQPILTTTAASTTTTEGNHIGNLTKEVENNVENSTAVNNSTAVGNGTTELVSSKFYLRGCVHMTSAKCLNLFIPLSNLPSHFSFPSRPAT